MDVKSAYLHSASEEEIYLEQPQGFTKEKNEQTLVCKFNKSTYGLNQAAKNWYVSLANLLTKNAFQWSRNDYCLFVRKEEDGTFLYILLWFDVIKMAGEHNVVDAIKSVLKKNFKIDDRGELRWFLGMWIFRSEDKIAVDRENYTQNIFNQFNMSDCKPKVTPGEDNVK